MIEFSPNWFFTEILRFHCDAINTAQKNKLETVWWKKPKKEKCYKRLIYKQFAQISGLCGPQFLCYLPKHFTHLCRALYGDAILVAARNQQKHLEFTFSIKALPFHSRASIRAHKHIFSYLKWLNCWKSYCGVTHCENSEVQIVVFSKRNMLRGWRLGQRFYFLSIFNLG